MGRRCFKLLACEVLTREIEYCRARSRHEIDVEYTTKAEHNTPARLRETLQKKIDAASAEDGRYDAILLGFALCGNATAGLVARQVPLVIPRAHDCTTLFLGSKRAFQEYFGANPSQAWASVGYSERGDTVVSDSSARQFFGLGDEYAALVERYGEENAKYIAETLRTEHGSNFIYLIDVPESRDETVRACIVEQAERAGKEVKVVPGSLRLIEALLGGAWAEDEFLVVAPGQRIAGVYDAHFVVEARPADPP